MRILLLTLPLVACNKGGVPLDTGAGDTIDDPGDISTACEDRADDVVTETYRVEFPATQGQCAWGQDGNLEQNDGYLTARVEQTASLSLADKVVCDMQFEFAGEAGIGQDFIYDDNFFFLFNGVVLAASYRPWVEALPAEGIFHFYDWDTIVGMENLFHGVPTYCVGDETDQADCEIPPPETQGPISLSFDLSITNELSYRAIDENRAEFGFVATGDNDAWSDCAHEYFYVDVEVPYLERW
jgi:hypothetical protein